VKLAQELDGGAVAVKVYKVMGMEMKSEAGKWVMVDDPAFEPIYKYIAKRNRTLVAHLAEPDSCWQPPNHASPDYEYYKEHPEEYAYMHSDWPSKAVSWGFESSSLVRIAKYTSSEPVRKPHYL